MAETETEIGDETREEVEQEIEEMEARKSQGEDVDAQLSAKQTELAMLQSEQAES